MIFESARLVARRFAEGDFDAFVAMRADPEVARYQAWENYTAEDGAKRFAELQTRNPKEPGWFQFALESKATGVFIGDCGLKIMESDNRLAEIGYTFIRAHWNQGYATEAIRALTAYAFAGSAIHRITASVDPENIGSCRALEKAGYRREGLFRKSVWFKGRWDDDAIYARLRED
jgi:[ribosomal protein S5]-alanine N-acetyltransferase